MRAVRLALVMTVAACVLAGCAAPAVSSKATPAQIVSSVCTRCHPVDRIKAADHDAAAWKVTVDRMRGKGAQLTDAQEAKVVSFLAAGGASSL
jgi:uncharacterized lipoprotein YajG